MPAPANVAPSAGHNFQSLGSVRSSGSGATISHACTLVHSMHAHNSQTISLNVKVIDLS